MHRFEHQTRENTLRSSTTNGFRSMENRLPVDVNATRPQANDVKGKLRPVQRRNKKIKIKKKVVPVKVNI